MAAGKWIRVAGRVPARPRTIAALCLGALGLVSLSGCSLIGLGVGSVVNSAHSGNVIYLPPERAAYLPTGTSATFVMSDSTRITGVVLDPQFSNGVDSRQTVVRLAYMRSESPPTPDTLRVPTDRIAYARASSPLHAARKGFHAGLIVDLTLLGLAAIAALLLLIFFLILASSGFSFG